MQADRGASLSENAADRSSVDPHVGAGDHEAGNQRADDLQTGDHPSDDLNPGSGPWSRRTPIVLLAVLCLAWLALDAVTKQLVVAHLQDRAPVRLLGGAVNLIYARNSGAAFSFAEGQTVLLTIVALLVVAAIIRVSRRLNSIPWAVSLGLILGGALGNLADRIFRDPAPFRGAVVDWISLGAVHGYIWPTFNVADSGLTIGVILAVVLEISGRALNGSRRRGAAGE